MQFMLYNANILLLLYNATGKELEVLMILKVLIGIYIKYMGEM